MFAIMKFTLQCDRIFLNNQFGVTSSERLCSFLIDVRRFCYNIISISVSSSLKGCGVLRSHFYWCWNDSNTVLLSLSFFSKVGTSTMFIPFVQSVSTKYNSFRNTIIFTKFFNMFLT